MSEFENWLGKLNFKKGSSYKIRRFLFNAWAVYLALFLVGVALHLGYLLLLLEIAPVDQWNWAHGDTKTYVRPAENFLEKGVFERTGVPDYYRTIGYPLFLSGMLFLGKTFDADWRLIVYIAQAIIFAIVYPTIYFIGVNVFGLKRRSAYCCVGFIVFSGAFVSYVPVILSDAMFSTALIVGLACGFCSLLKRSIIKGLLFTGLITYAANVRPMLVFFSFAAACMHWAYIRHMDWTSDRKRRFLIGAMFLFTLIGTQTPSLRNWMNHGVFISSEIGSINLFDYLARDVLAFTTGSNK